MISITIEDDGEVSLRTTNGIEETEIASAIVVEAMRSLKKSKPDAEYKLVLVSYDPTSKTAAANELSGILGLGIKEAEDIVDACVGRTMPVLSKGPKSKMNVLFDRFNPSIVQVKVIYD